MLDSKVIIILAEAQNNGRAGRRRGWVGHVAIATHLTRLKAFKLDLGVSHLRNAAPLRSKYKTQVWMSVKKKFRYRTNLNPLYQQPESFTE